MGKRREGREAAVQFLFQDDLNKTEPAALDAVLDDFWKLRESAPRTRQFASELIRGVLERQEAIDERIRKVTENYELHRIAPVDRNILRVAIYEMIYCSEVPPVVCINEAIEIAKRFGSEDSGRFVNGILDRLKEEVARPLR
ncbi:MAG TPA: transcription antitermination factor NusB [Chthoniobacteraceae bacterium]|jgi:N utilization substance protein B|nr:transcription antitermination factor NusB [Chthoniobacteraceae bacterium]